MMMRMLTEIRRRFAVALCVLLVCWSIPSSVYAEERIAASVTENFTPPLTINFACWGNISLLSDGDISSAAAYCPKVNFPSHVITFDFGPANVNHSFSSIVIWTNAGDVYTDNELRIFDLEVDYKDMANGGADATLIMNGVNIEDTIDANDPKTVNFKNSLGQNVILWGVSKIRLKNMKGSNMIVGADIPIREVRINFVDVSINLEKTSAVYNPSSSSFGQFATPGNDIIYSIKVSNLSTSYADNNSLFIVDAIPDDLEFYNGDIDGASGPEANPVSFSGSSTSLIFNYANDVRFSNSTVKPTSFAACNYSPVSGYDPAVNFICINPKGILNSPNANFTIKLRGRIKE